MDESRFLRGLFEGMRCGILCVDRGGRLVVLNGLGARILNLAEPPTSGSPLSAALPGQPRLVQLLLESLGVASLPNREELTLDRPGGRGKTIGYTLSRIGVDDGESEGLAMFFKDLTLIERKEEHERLRDRLAALGQMAASMAHEIRNPLASIEVTCSLLRRRLLGEDDSRALLDRITAEVRRLNGTINSSLEFVRPVSLDPVATEVLPLLDQAIRVAVDRCGVERGVVQTDFDRALPLVEIDAPRVRQVFENLLLNAIEAAGEDGAVRVTTTLIEQYDPNADDGGAEVQRWLEVRIADDGPGIAEADAGRIFTPFFTTKDHGSGVGLATAKKIIDCHHGLIDVQNQRDGGAVFTVRLPLTQQRSEASDR